CTTIKCFQVKSFESDIHIVDVTNPSFCYGNSPESNCTGSIEIEVIGNNGPYTYSWSGPNGFTSTSEDITELCPGVYRISVTNESGCTASKTVDICCCELFLEPGQPEPPLCSYPETPPVNFSGNVTPLSVSGANDGAINLTTAGGSGNYIFNWSGPNNYYASSEDIYNLSAGEYCVTVSDGCEESHGCFEIAFCGDFDIQISGVVTPTCHGFNY